MKKILVLIMVVFMAVLSSCDNNDLKENKYSFDLTLEEMSTLRESLVFDFVLSDEDNLLKNSEVSYTVVEKETEKTVKSGTLTIASDNKSTLTVSGLTADTTYDVTFTAGYKGKNILLMKKEITTSNLGTAEHPYEISNVTDLKNFIANDRTASFKLTKDIDLEGKFITPICKSSSTFSGTFDGNGYAIKNFKTGTAENPTSLSGTAYGGLFGYVSAKGTIKNLKFDGVELYLSRSSSASIAVVAGYNAGVIDNVDITNAKLYFKGSSYRDYYVGSVVAYNADHGTVKNCDVECDIELTTTTGNFIAGGIIGYNESEAELPIRNIVEDCTYKGKISLTSSGTATQKIEIALGGIAGRNYSTIRNCSAEVDFVVKAETSKASSNEEDLTEIKDYRVLVGGVAGHNVSDSALLANCNVTASFDVEAKYAGKVYVGSLLGQNGARENSKASIKNCAYTLPTDAVNKVSALNHTADATVNCGLIGKDLATQSGLTTNAHSFTVEYYHYVKDDADKNVLELETTETINVVEISE